MAQADDDNWGHAAFTQDLPAMTNAAQNAIPDVQGSADNREIPINKVGIKGVKHPVIIGARDGTEQHTVAEFNMYVNLPQHFKGTHMSRFVQVLNEHETPISVATFKTMLEESSRRLEASSSHIEMNFPFFVTKSAPVSGVKSLMDYNVTLIGEYHNHIPNLFIKVVVPVTSLCPCSKNISDYGAHNQRAHITIKAELETERVWIEDLLEIAEQEASCELFSVLKRPDEKYVTEKAYDTPKFVEDLVRDVAGRLNQDERIKSYELETENFESIHNHSAYAYIESSN